MIINDVQPIDSLTPFIGSNWCICARVTDKSDIRVWNKPNSQGKLFSFTLIDESSAIRATMFNEAVDMFERTILNGRVYRFKGGYVKNANTRFSNVNPNYEVTFDTNCTIEPVNNSSMSVAIPQQRYNFVTIELLAKSAKNAIVDILAVITEVGPLGTTNQRSTGKELQKRVITVSDFNASVAVTVWNEEAVSWSYDVGTVLAMQQLKVGEYNGVTLSSSFQSKIEIAPQSMPDVRRLSEWYISTGGSNVKSLSNNTGAGAGTGGKNFRGRKFLSDITTEGLGSGAVPDFIEVRCVPTYIAQNRQWYNACPTCNKKVTANDVQETQFRCEKCDAVVTPNLRYLISLQVTDNVDQVWVTLFDDSGMEFFGMAASELKARSENDPTYVTKLMESRMNRPVLMRLRVKKEPALMSNADMGNADRVQLSVMHITEFISLGDASDSTTSTLVHNLRVECDELIKSIECYA